MYTLADYLALIKARPELFENPPGCGYTILREEEDIKKAEEEKAEELAKNDQPVEWARVGIVYRDQYLLLLRDAIEYPDKKTRGTYIRTIDQRPGVVGVVILPVYKDHVLLIRHFRHATRTWHLEIPRGAGQTMNTEEDALRELNEEISGTATRLVSLGKVYPDTGASSEQVALFYAEVDSYGEAQMMEAITAVLPIAFPAFDQMIRKNEISDGFTLMAYARAKAQNLL